MTYLGAGLNLIKLLNNEGYSSFIVGGAVRDYLLGVKLHDVDIASSILPSELKAIFEVKETGLKYNSVTVCFEGYEFEVTTFRRDLTYLDNRHPVYEVADNLEADIVRRDFTVNGLALDKDLNLIDLVGGKADLDNKVLRAIGNPAIRFNEDSLRILRAVYFYAKLDFQIEENTLKAMKDCGFLVQNLSYERVREELEKMIATDNYLKAFELLVLTRINTYLKDFSQGVSYVLNQNIIDLTPILFLALTYYQKDIKDLQIKEKRKLEIVYSLLDQDLSDKMVLYQYELEDVLLANKINKIFNKKNYSEDKIRALKEALPLRNIRDLAIDGNDIQKELQVSGTLVGYLLNKAVEAVIYNKKPNDYQKLIAYLKRVNR